MKKKGEVINIHTNKDKPIVLVRLLRRGIKIGAYVSHKITLKIVEKLFCKPSKGKTSAYQKAFYSTGVNQTITVYKYKINVFSKGEGEPVLMIHGWNNRAYSLRHIANKLVTEGYKVIIPDLPCHGKSSGIFIDQIEMGYALQGVLSYVKKEYGDFKLITYSWGGTATLLAMDQLRKKGKAIYPQKIISLSLPTYPNAIMDLFCEMLDLSDKLKKGLEKKLIAIAKKDNRTLAEAFPIFLSETIEDNKFKLTIIHDEYDEAIAVDNCERFVKKFPKTNSVFTQNLGHIKILKAPEVMDCIVTNLSA